MIAMDFLRVWDESGDSADLEVADEPRIDAAVQQFLTTGGRVDTLLDLTMVSGSPYRILASSIRSWTVSTPETRQRQREWNKVMQEEEREGKHALGIWEDDAAA